MPNTPVTSPVQAAPDHRASVWDDVENVCTWLNEQGAIYCLHGGWALQTWLEDSPDYAGDIDIAIPRRVTEYEKLRLALAHLPGQKILRFPAELLAKKLVVRLLDDICVDVITNIGGIEFFDLEILPVTRPSGLVIPMVSGDCLYRIKQYVARRDPKHIRDLMRLRDRGYNGNYTGRGVIALPPAALEE